MKALLLLLVLVACSNGPDPVNQIVDQAWDNPSTRAKFCNLVTDALANGHDPATVYGNAVEAFIVTETVPSTTKAKAHIGDLLHTC